MKTIAPGGFFKRAQETIAIVFCIGVGANLAIMRSDTIQQRTTPKGLKPFVMTNLKTLDGLDDVVGFIEKQGLLVNGNA